jgi:hypothetical protein
VATFGASAAPKAAPAPRKPATKPAVSAGALSEAERVRFFQEQVRPILQEKCVSCHSGEKPQSDLRLTSRAAVLKGGGSGPAVSLQKPSESLILSAVNYDGLKMPPQGKLPAKQVEILTRWVSMGLPWATGDQASLEPKGHAGPPPVTPETMKFWSFQPVRRPAVPKVKNAKWVRNPIDAFVLARLEKEGMQPNPPASRQALIRRAYYDLTGLPPTFEQVQAFVSDQSPNAWEKAVDQLLASPHYGEKWGRHWLDLVRYAETNSYERDGDKPNAWRYRDYVIRSFNEDKPYDQFIKEQLAGDEQAPRTAERMIATGYYRLGIWDDEPADPEQALYDDLDDIARTTGEVFLGMTIGCARCHDHKIDPIPQKDYYSFLAFFSGVKRFGQRSYESIRAASLRDIKPEGEEARRFQEQLAAHEARTKRNDERIGALETKILGFLVGVEKDEWQNERMRLRLARKHVPAELSEDEFKRYEGLVKERQGLRDFRPTVQALAVTEGGTKAPDMFVLLRGNPHVPGDKVSPAFPSVLAPPQPQIAPTPFDDTSGRRTALANWIASQENPLTARVMANRVWHYHFGRGIVRSTSNFGFQGDKPTHPALLDWLASELATGGGAGKSGEARAWTMKRIHRLIMLSSTYQMSSTAQPKALAKDPENDLMWRFDMRRLQAEEIRDAILAANGSLNEKMGGPSFYPDMPAEVLAGQSMPGAGWGKSSPEDQCRRSVYIFVKRSLAVPLIANFDGPETDFTCQARFATTQPTQALGMLNSKWTNDQARVFANFLKAHAGPKTEDRVRLCLERTLQRVPTAAEITRGVKLINALQQDEHLDADAALASYCLVALNLNEFIYLD